MAHPHKSSYTSNYLIVNCQKGRVSLPCKAMAHSHKFKPYKATSNAEYQQTWYQKNKEKRAEYDKQRTLRSEYQESHKKSSQKHRQSKKKVGFPPSPPFAELCRVMSEYCIRFLC